MFFAGGAKPSQTPGFLFGSVDRSDRSIGRSVDRSDWSIGRSVDRSAGQIGFFKKKLIKSYFYKCFIKKSYKILFWIYFLQKI